MPKACASRATFLPIVPSPTMPSTLSRTWWTVGGALPCQRPAVTLACWVISRRDTASISSSGVLGDRHRVGAAVVAQRHLALARRLEVGAVVAGAQHLDQLEPGRVLVELRRHVLLHEAHEVARCRAAPPSSPASCAAPSRSRSPWARGRRPWRSCPWARPRVRVTITVPPQRYDDLSADRADARARFGPSRIRPTSPNSSTALTGRGDAGAVAGLVVVVQQAEIEPGPGRPLPAPERRVVGVVGAVLGHGNVQEVDAPAAWRRRCLPSSRPGWRRPWAAPGARRAASRSTGDSPSRRRPAPHRPAAPACRRSASCSGPGGP